MEDICHLSKRFFDSNNKKEKRFLASIHKQLSLHVCENPWFELDYGVNPHGLLAATPTDMMHLFELGVISYVIEMFFQSMTDSIKTVE